MRKKFLPVALLFGIGFLLFAVCGGVRMAEHAAVFAQTEEQKTIYLTFDDGPSTVVTNRILDTLRRERVRATFFIVSDRALTRRETLRRIAEEGLAIGIHSASHDYGKIYSSDAAFAADVDECARVIEEIAGVRPRLYRFPGGGPNKEEREQKELFIRERGYRIVSWNAVCGDEEIPYADAATLVRQSIATSKGKRSVVLLMHDSAHHAATADALPAIIGYFREQGYEFRLFSESLAPVLP